MGLDVVEIVLEAEKQFGISIKDEDAEHLTTPGKLADYVTERIRTDAPCPSQAGFYRIRSVMTSALGIARKRVHPHARLSDLIQGDVPKNWKILQKALDARHFPRLEHGKAIIGIVGVGIPVTIGIALLVMGIPFIASVMWSFALFLLANLLIYNRGTLIPGNCQTVAALIPFAHPYSTVRGREDVLRQIIRITAQQLTIPVEAISEHAEFVRDLGAD